MKKHNNRNVCLVQAPICPNCDKPMIQIEGGGFVCYCKGSAFRIPPDNIRKQIESGDEDGACAN